MLLRNRDKTINGLFVILVGVVALVVNKADYTFKGIAYVHKKLVVQFYMVSVFENGGKFIELVKNRP